MKKAWDQEKRNKYSPADVRRWSIEKEYTTPASWEIYAIFSDEGHYSIVGKYDTHAEAVAEVDRLDALSSEEGGAE